MKQSASLAGYNCSFNHPDQTEDYFSQSPSKAETGISHAGNAFITRLMPDAAFLVNDFIYLQELMLQTVELNLQTVELNLQMVNAY